MGWTSGYVYSGSFADPLVNVPSVRAKNMVTAIPFIEKQDTVQDKYPKHSPHKEDSFQSPLRGCVPSEILS